MSTSGATPTTRLETAWRPAPGRVGLLVSVRNAVEATAALAGGADIVDIKEPANGPLGAPLNETVQTVLAVVRAQAPVTVALGELTQSPAIEALPRGVDALKVGLAGSRRGDWRAGLRRLSQGTGGGMRLVPVAYADSVAADAPRPLEVLEAAADLGGGWLVVDTWDKRSGDLLTLLDETGLAALLYRAEQLGVWVGLAGRLAGEPLRKAVALGPALVGVRGAVCDGGRAGVLSADRVREVASACRAVPLTRA